MGKYDWKQELEDFFLKTKASSDIKQKVYDEKLKERDEFYTQVVFPAFTEIRDELDKRNRKVELENPGEMRGVTITVWWKGIQEIKYSIQLTYIGSKLHPLAYVYSDAVGRPFQVKSQLKRHRTNYFVKDISKNDITRNFVENYKNEVLYLQRHRPDLYQR